MVDEIMRREQPEMWSRLPPRVKQAVYTRVQQQLPGIVRQITDEIGVHIDQLLEKQARNGALPVTPASSYYTEGSDDDVIHVPASAVRESIPSTLI